MVRVVDGDTIYVSSDLDFLKIRLSDIDTPELNQAYGNEAKRYLSNLIYNKKVSIRISSTDRYGRHIGRIFLNDVDINSLLVEKGLAWVYRKYTKDQSLIALESSARTKKLGLWANSKAVEP